MKGAPHNVLIGPGSAAPIIKPANAKPRILALIPYYRPGFKGGGPITSLEALVGRLKGDFSWTIATSDRDYKDRARYASIPKDGAVVRGGLQVRYLSPGPGRLLRLARLLRGDDYDLLYLNDMFSAQWGVWPLVLHRLGCLKKRPVLVAPRNQFSQGALSIKRLKKRMFLRIARWSGLWKGVSWHATGQEELDEIEGQAGARAMAWVAPEFPNANVWARTTENVPLEPGPLRIVFLSRISAMKNLDIALEVIQWLPFPVQFDIAGPVDDDAYWQRIRTLIARLPRHITATHLGPVEPSHVQALLGSYHAMLLPTRGENFGHVILEALAAGCPPIISDRTPWKDLMERGCGWVIPLDDKDGFRKAVTELNAMGPEDRERMRSAARQYARSYIANLETKEMNRKMFQEVIGSSKTHAAGR